jgi:hypothetical protein
MNIFLIDADNLNSDAWVDEAFRVLEASEGPLPVRRAYGSAENLKGLADVLRAWAVRPFVNLALTKNTTDIALAVDAMEFACQTPQPGMVIIGSGDADFVPLVVRLRERGIRVVCVSERSKMGREAVAAYDRVVLVGPEQGSLPDAAGLAVAPRKPAAKKAVKAKKPASKAAAKKVPANKVATKTPAVKKTSGLPKPAVSAESVAPESAANPMHQVDVAAILQAVPALQGGQPQALAAVAKALLDAKLRGKNLTATKLLKKFPQQFLLAPPEKPRTVQYTPQQGQF